MNGTTEPLIKLLLTFGLWRFSTSISTYNFHQNKTLTEPKEGSGSQMDSDNWSYFYFQSISSNALWCAHHMARQQTTIKWTKTTKKRKRNIVQQAISNHHHQRQSIGLSECCSVLMTFIYNHTKIQRRLLSTNVVWLFPQKTIRCSRLFRSVFLFRQVCFLGMSFWLTLNRRLYVEGKKNWW